MIKAINIKRTALSTKRAVVGALGFLALLTFGGEVRAAVVCTGSGAPETVTLPASITVPRGVPNGTMLTPWIMGRQRGPWTCISQYSAGGNGGGSQAVYVGTGSYETSVAPPSASGYNALVVSTNVPGIGLAISSLSRVCVQADGTGGSSPGWSDQVLFPRVGRSYCVLDIGNYTHLTYIQSAFALVKIGEVSAGQIVGNNILRLEPWVGGTNPGGTWSPVFVSISSVQVVPQSCDLAIGDVNRTIMLPSVKVSDFGSVNYAGAKNFELTAECQNASNVTFTFAGIVASGNGQLFANNGTASGVGLWLYSRDGSTNSTIPANGTESQRQRTVSVSSNKAVLPMGAAYHKTTGSVTAGTLNSVVTVNITYD